MAKKGTSLCKLVKDQILKEDLADYKILVKKPKYVCEKCDRAARRKRNLCDPSKL